MGTPNAIGVAGEIRAELARQRVSQRSLSQSIGMYPSLLSRRLDSPDDFTLGELERICGSLGVTLAELIARSAKVAA